MSNYYTLKNSSLYQPLVEDNLGELDYNFGNIYLTGNVFVNNEKIIEPQLIRPRVISLLYPSAAFAANVGGGETLSLQGFGFKPNAVVRIANVVVNSVTVVNSSLINFVAPAKSTGIYTLSVTNTDGGVGVWIPGIEYSPIPVWSTPAGNRLTVYETQSVSTQIAVTSQDIPNIYQIESGSLPSGVTLDSGTGQIVGTAPIVTESNVYSITASATDYQQQQAFRNFSFTVNPAPVTWNSPNSGATYTQDQNTAFNLALSASNPINSPITYSATNLPAGISVAGNTLTGTLTTAQTKVVTLTASAPAVQKSANRTITITALPPMSVSTVMGSSASWRAGIDNYGTPQITRNSNLWLVPEAMDAQVGDLVFLAYWANYQNFGVPTTTGGFTELSTMIARSNFAQLRIGMAVQMKILDSTAPIEISRGSGSVTNQTFIARVFRPSRPISNIWVHTLNQQTYEDSGGDQLAPGASCVQTIDGTGLTNYTRFHIAAAQCEDVRLPQLQTSTPTFDINQRDLTEFTGYWPISNWPLDSTPPSPSVPYAFIDQGGNFGSPWGQFCLTAYNKGTAGISQQVRSGANNRSYGVEYSQMSAIVVIE